MTTCTCDGGSYEVRSHPFIVNPQCRMHGALGGGTTVNDYISAGDFRAELQRLGARGVDTASVEDFNSMLAEVERAAAEKAWDERGRARADYSKGHDEDCTGWEDCYCARYPNPYRKETA